MLLWCKKVEQLGAGEILLTSMDKDGTKNGFDNELLSEVSKRVNIQSLRVEELENWNIFYKESSMVKLMLYLRQVFFTINCYQ